MHPRLASWSVLALFCLGACTPDLGPCDELRARRIVYDETGSPALEGQALIIQSCGFGAFCHSANIPSDQRHGTHAGLEYDLRLVDADFDPAAPEEAYARLQAMHERAFRDRHEIWREVQRGRMPVGGRLGADLASAAPEYSRIGADGALVPMPGLGSAEGQDALKNWLSCGLPIVQGTPRDDAPQQVLGYTADALEVEPLEPRWDDIYARLIEPRCASAPCHGTAVAGDLDLRGERGAYDAMVGVAAQADACRNTALALIEAGDAEASLLVAKLAGVTGSGERVCGDPMPVGLSRVSEASVANIRAWIDGGAQLSP